MCYVCYWWTAVIQSKDFFDRQTLSFKAECGKPTEWGAVFQIDSCRVEDTRETDGLPNAWFCANHFDFG